MGEVYGFCLRKKQFCRQTWWENVSLWHGQKKSILEVFYALQNLFLKKINRVSTTGPLRREAIPPPPTPPLSELDGPMSKYRHQRNDIIDVIIVGFKETTVYTITIILKMIINIVMLRNFINCAFRFETPGWSLSLCVYKDLYSNNWIQ